MYNQEHYLLLLRGAICEYLDEGLMDELIEDMIVVAKEEEESFREKAEIYKKLRKKLVKLQRK